jgi:hypothetical protein
MHAIKQSKTRTQSHARSLFCVSEHRGIRQHLSTTVWLTGHPPRSMAGIPCSHMLITAEQWARNARMKPTHLASRTHASPHAVVFMKECPAAALLVWQTNTVGDSSAGRIGRCLLC